MYNENKGKEKLHKESDLKNSKTDPDELKRVEDILSRCFVKS